jgi:type I restriction enzyme S subunit
MSAIAPPTWMERPPEGWREAPFDDLLSVEQVERRPSIPRSKFQRSGRFPVVDQGQSLIAGFTDEDSAVHREDLPIILFGDHTRAVKYVDFPFAAGADGTKLLRPRSPDLDPRFLYFALLAIDLPSRGYNRHFGLLRERVFEIPIGAPEQRTIAGVLSKLQAAVEVQDRIVGALKDLKAATMAKLFREGLRGERLKQTEIGEIPESWEIETVGSCITNDLIEGHPTIPRSAFRRHGPYPIVDQGQGTIAGFTETADAVHSGDLPLILFGDHTRTLKFIDFPFAAGADGTKLFHGNPERIDTEFLYHVLSRLQLPSRGYNRHFGILREKRIAYPPDRSEQAELAALARALDDRVGRAEAAVERRRRLFETMLGSLVSGRLRLSANTTDEG